MLNSKQYQGTSHTDKVIHDNLIPILNYFKSSSDTTTVKIMSNTKAINHYNQTDFDEDQLKRNLHNFTHLRVQKYLGEHIGYDKPEYYYVTTNDINRDNEHYISLREELIMAWATKDIHNTYVLFIKSGYLSIIKLYDIMHFYVEVKKSHNHDYDFTSGNYKYFLYPQDKCHFTEMNKTPRTDLSYYDNWHVGTCSYSTRRNVNTIYITGYNPGTGKKINSFTYRSIKEAWDLLINNYGYVIEKCESYKTFQRRVHSKSLLKCTNGKGTIYVIVSEEEPEDSICFDKVNVHTDVFGTQVWDTEIKSWSDKEVECILKKHKEDLNKTLAKQNELEKICAF